MELAAPPNIDNSGSSCNFLSKTNPQPRFSRVARRTHLAFAQGAAGNVLAVVWVCLLPVCRGSVLLRSRAERIAVWGVLCAPLNAALLRRVPVSCVWWVIADQHDTLNRHFSSFRTSFLFNPFINRTAVSPVLGTNYLQIDLICPQNGTDCGSINKRVSVWKRFTRPTDHDLDNHLGHLERNLPWWGAVQDLYRPDPSQETCAGSCPIIRLSPRQREVRVDHTVQEPIFPEISTSWNGHRSYRSWIQIMQMIYPRREAFCRLNMVYFSYRK